MSVEAQVTAADAFFIGEDKRLSFDVRDAAGLPVDIAPWSLRWVLRRTLRSGELVVKATGGGIAIEGGYHADPLLHTQRAVVTVADVDTDPLPPGVYVHALKRVDADHEAVLADGPITLLLAATR